MKNLLILLFLSAALATFAQKKSTDAITGGKSVQLVKKDSTEEYGRGYLLIQTSEGLDSTTVRGLKKLYKEMWRDGIILYIGIQIGKPTGNCGTPGHPPC